MFVKQKVYKRSWGVERVLHSSEKYAFKMLDFKAGGQIRLHFHTKKTQTWFVASGSFDVTLLDAATGLRIAKTVTPGMAVHIRAGVPHAVICFQPGQIYEASTEEIKADRHGIKMRF